MTENGIPFIILSFNKYSNKHTISLFIIRTTSQIDQFEEEILFIVPISDV